ncbi:TetR family transcriptional regulator [Fuscibacter oryzae]|uniref:TetR family transcriptional regulator C-terminal domain-containing protein n=1 Tax=Fuscibacter oryzae TaxID=2803939 RepID=A0A8J7MQV8_9RHOB|nr:TetR family transcriptional regulator [Fuscibacter oryzae]MBL4928168.1 TetR family transcriptional regulator C-terminal domain-containing protein [Fuscibacter oryzae]
MRLAPKIGVQMHHAQTAADLSLPRKQPRDARRAQLIEATIEVLARQGYARVTMADVARRAGLSHGLVNFHFHSKENLLVETLIYLAEEYRQNWTTALERAGDDPADRLHAMLTADFNPEIFTPSRIAAWCSYWGEAQSRPLYQERCGSNDLAYMQELESLCARMIARHGYTGNAERMARVLRVTVEGMWLDMVTIQTPYSREEARATVLTSAAALFPRHFTEAGLIGGSV